MQKKFRVEISIGNIFLGTKIHLWVWPNSRCFHAYYGRNQVEAGEPYVFTNSLARNIRVSSTLLHFKSSSYLVGIPVTRFLKKMCRNFWKI